MFMDDEKNFYSFIIVSNINDKIWENIFQMGKSEKNAEKWPRISRKKREEKRAVYGQCRSSSG